MAEQFNENYDYAKLNKQINRKFDAGKFADLRTVPAVRSTYDKKAAPTENIQALVRSALYPDNQKLAYRHSFDIFHAIHEQAIVQGIENGFNGVAQALRTDCEAIEITNGKIRFLDSTNNVLYEFEAASSRRTDLGEQKEIQRKNIVHTTRAELEALRPSLRTLLPGFKGSLRPPNYHPNTFRLSPAAFIAANEPPALLDLKHTGETVCAGYVTELLRYYIGSKNIDALGLENTDAWEFKETLRAAGALSVEASMNKFLRVKNGRIQLSFAVINSRGKVQRVVGEQAKMTPYYASLYRKFYRAAAPEKSPPGIITLYYHGTHRNREIIDGNTRDGLDSRNSHVAINLGEARKSLTTGKFRSPDEEKKVIDIVWANFSGVKRNLDWMLLDAKNPASRLSRVYLNGEQLAYRKKTLYRRDGSVALAREGDTVEWEDIMVADRSYRQNRLKGLTELMLTGNYELVDALSIKPEALQQETMPARIVPPYRVTGIEYLRKGETLGAHLRKTGVPSTDLPYHLYAYEKIGLNAARLRPFDPVPVFNVADIRAEVQASGGLLQAIASVRTAHAAEYASRNPGSHIFVIRPKDTPQKMAREILALPEFAPLGVLSGREKQFILTTVAAVQKNIAFQCDNQGRITAVYRFNAGDELYLSKDLLGAIVGQIEKKRVSEMVFVPPSLSGGTHLRSPSFSEGERQIIENATNDPATRAAMALILTMEQKQEEGLVSRGTVKAFANWTGLKESRSLGLFQVRILPSDRTRAGVTDADAFREKVAGDPALNAELAATRVQEIMRRAESIFASHGEEFDPNSARGMAYVLNCYHASEAKVLANTIGVWAALIEEKLMGSPSPESAENVSSPKLAQRFKRIGEALRIKGALTLSSSEIAADASLITAHKIDFLRSPLLSAIEGWWSGQGGAPLSLNIPESLVDRADIKTTFLNYGTRATRYGALDAIAFYSDMRREGDVPDEKWEEGEPLVSHEEYEEE